MSNSPPPLHQDNGNIAEADLVDVSLVDGSTIAHKKRMRLTTEHISYIPCLEMLNEYSLFNKLLDMRNMFATDELYDQTKGLVLISEKTREYDSSPLVIKHVPIDPRDSCCELMIDSMVFQERFNKPSVVGCGAMDGSGKSVLQLINMLEFVHHTKGIAIEVDLSDEPKMSLQSPYPFCVAQFKDAIAVHIMRCLITYKYGERLAKRRAQSDSSFMKSLVALENPICSALSMVVRCLNAPMDVKLQLCIKGLSNYVQSPDLLAHLITSIADIYVTPFQFPSDQPCSSPSPRVQLTLALKSAYELVLLKARGGPGITAQTLPPLLIDSNTDANLLPPMLQMFFDSAMTTFLPRDSEAQKVYNTIASLLMASGNNPGRLSVVLGIFAEFPIQDILGREAIAPLNKEECALLVAGVQEWLDSAPFGTESRYQQILHSMDMRCDFSVDRIKCLITEFQGSKSCADVIESLAVDTTILFTFPCEEGAIRFHRVTLKATELGCCSFLGNDNQYAYYAYYPLPILEYLPPSEMLNPCGQALVMLRDSLKRCCEFGSEDNMAGVPFAQSILCAVLLYTRCKRYQFEPMIFCETNYCGWKDDSLELPGGNNIEYWNDIEHFLLSEMMEPTINKHVEHMICKLDPDSPGAFFIPSAQPSYVIGFFRTFESSQDFWILVFQTTDWNRMADDETSEVQYETCKEEDHTDRTPNPNRKQFKPPHYPSLSCNITDSDGQEQTVFVKFSHIVMSASHINEITHENQGSATIKTMLKWNPTAGYPLLCAYNLHRLFVLS